MESLKKNADFKNCYNSGKSFVNKYLVLYLCGNGLGRNRYGISVSKKVGNSVVRHRVKRLLLRLTGKAGINISSGKQSEK